MRKIKLFIAVSLDGYIARKNDDLDWLNAVEQEGEDYGYQHFIDTVDTVILGQRTYNKVLGMAGFFPHQNKKSYIITRTPKPNTDRLIFYTGNLASLVSALREADGKDIFCDGGAYVVTELMKINAIDEFIISVIPLFLGDGIRLFKDNRPEMQLRLTGYHSYPTGLVQLRYERIKMGSLTEIPDLIPL